MKAFSEMNVNRSKWEMNGKGAHAIDQQARQAEMFYQKQMQIEIKHSPVQPFTREDTSRGTIFNKVSGSILAVIHRFSGKRLSLKADDLGEMHSA